MADREEQTWPIGRDRRRRRSCTGCRIASPAVVAEPRLRRWHRDRNYFDANDAILILSRYSGSLSMLLVLLVVV